MIQQLNSLRQDLNTISNMAHQLSQAEQHNSMQLQKMHQMAEGMERNIQHLSGGAQQFGTHQFGTSFGQTSPFTTQPQFGTHPNMGVTGAASSPISAAMGQSFVGPGQTQSRSLAPVNTPFENPIGAAQRNFDNSYEQGIHPNMGLVGHSSNPIGAAHRENLNYTHNMNTAPYASQTMNRPLESNIQWGSPSTNTGFSSSSRSNLGLSN